MASKEQLTKQISSISTAGQKRPRNEDIPPDGIDSKRRILDLPHSTRVTEKHEPASRTGFMADVEAVSDSVFPPLPRINDPEIERKVFLHQSHVTEQALSQFGSSATYESLEWYGDAVIQITATRLIHKRYPTKHVGDKASIRQSLVENATLAEFARRYDFDRSGKIKMNDRIREYKQRLTKILADVFEAYVGAVVESDPDNGMRVVEAWLAQLWEPQLALTDRDKTKISNRGHKQRLTQLLMNSRAKVKIEYVDAEPPDNRREKGKVWHSRKVLLTGWGFESEELGRGAGWSLMFAENEAANHALHMSWETIEVANNRKRKYEAQRKAELDATAD